MSRIDRAALIISVAAVLISAIVSERIYERIAHLEDEMAYVWQARVIARGQLTVPSPQPCTDCFLVPFVVDFQGLRFGKYPLGWPVLLAFGELLDMRWMVNPLLTGLGVWWIYRLAKKLLDERTALLAALLTVVSPFVLLNSGTLLSHPWSLLLTAVFVSSWVDAFILHNPLLPGCWARVLPAFTAALALGLLALTRPLTAVGVALPFVVHGLYLLAIGPRDTRKLLAAFAFFAGSLSALHFLWQFAVTGDALLNPYTLWWPYDNIGFGPGVGLQKGGFQPIHALAHTKFSLRVGASDLFGWPALSYIFLPFGLWAVRKNRPAWLAAAVAPALIAVYLLYWVGSWVYGPRYYYEAIISAVILTAAGIRWLAGRTVGNLPGAPWAPFTRVRFAAVTGLVLLLVTANLLYYTPARLAGMKGYARISDSCLKPFSQPVAREAVPALVFVHIQEKYNEYGCLLELNSPFMDSDFVIALSGRSQTNDAVARSFPDRNILHYYPDTGEFLDVPRDTTRR